MIKTRLIFRHSGAYTAVYLTKDIALLWTDDARYPKVAFFEKKFNYAIISDLNDEYGTLENRTDDEVLCSYEVRCRTSEVVVFPDAKLHLPGCIKFGKAGSERLMLKCERVTEVLDEV